MVIVLADRSLYAKWLFEAIVELKCTRFAHQHPRLVSFDNKVSLAAVSSAWRLPKDTVARKGTAFAARKQNYAAHCDRTTPSAPNTQSTQQ